MFCELVQAPCDLFRLINDDSNNRPISLTVMAVVSWAANIIDLIGTDSHSSRFEKKRARRRTSFAE